MKRAKSLTHGVNVQHLGAQQMTFTNKPQHRLCPYWVRAIHVTSVKSFSFMRLAHRTWVLAISDPASREIFTPGLPEKTGSEGLVS